MPNGEWDVFGWSFGCGLPIDWFDVAAIEALLDARETSQSAIDRLVVGWNGEQEDVWPIIQKMLRARGYFIGPTAEGKITFARLRMATVVDADDPTTIAPIPRTLRMQPSEGEGVDRIIGNFEASPWSDGVPFEINILAESDTTEPSNSLRASLFADKTQVELDLSVLTAPEDNAADLVSLAVYRAFGAPLLFIRANDPDNISSGDLLKVSSPNTKKPWFIDADGVLVDAGDEPKWFGQVIGFDRKLLDGSIDLVLLMHNWHHNKFARLRAPSAIIASGTTTLTLAAAFSPDGDDAAEFTVDDNVELWQPDGTRRSGTSGAPDVQQITAIGVNSLTLNAGFTTPPVAGDVLRISNIDDFPDTGNPAKFASFLAYTYAAELDETLGSNELDSHIYSFGAL